MIPICNYFGLFALSICMWKCPQCYACMCGMQMSEIHVNFFVRTCVRAIVYVADRMLSNPESFLTAPA